MKRVNNLYQEVCKIENIEKMCDAVCSKVKNKQKAENFVLYKAEHIYNIKKRLENMDLNFSHYRIFFITDPKCRIIMSQNIEDKVINHLYAKYFLVNVFENKFTNSMCATRINKGSSYGIKLLKKYIYEIKNKNDNFYVLKLDIKKYFYSIDHDILKGFLKNKVKDKKALYVLGHVISSTDESYINNKILSLKKKRIDYLLKINSPNSIKEVNEIPIYEKGKGCAIGNQTSQIFGLIYLNEFNHYLKEKLHLKYVVNYMDDFIILHQDKEYLKRCLILIEEKLSIDYKLNLNMKKTKIESIKQGIEFLGYYFCLKNNKLIIKLRRRTKKNLKKRYKNNRVLFEKSYISEKEFKMIMSSYKGMLEKGSCGTLNYKYMNMNEVYRKMLDLFRQLKIEYKDYVLLFKSGKFYTSFDEDATIINNVFKYKLTELKNNIRVGFPANLIDKNCEKLKSLNINYLLVEDYDIKDKYISDNNCFDNYKQSVFELVSINKKLNKLFNKLTDIEDIKLKKELLSKMEGLLENV